MTDNYSILQRFRWIAIAEGISFIVLLFVAMPLKYFADTPQAVTVVGWIHGALFVAFIGSAFVVKSSLNKNLVWLAKAFAASIIPFGTFFFDKELKRDLLALKS